MDQTTENKVLDALYDRLFQAITYSPSGQNSPFKKESTFIQFAKNMAINPKDFSNAVTPSNPKGSLTNAESFARMVDNTPVLDSDYSTSGITSDTYKEIISNANANVKDDPDQKALYDKAYNYLNKKVTIIGFNGEETTSIQPTPIFDSYNKNKTAYITALSSYRTAYLSYDLTKLEDQRAWQANEPLLQNAVTQTYNTWRTQGADQVEQAQAALASSINNIVSSVIADTKASLRSSTMASNLGIPSDWYMTYASPSNWCDDSAAANFSSLTLKSSNLAKTADSSYTDYSVGGGGSRGLWSVSVQVDGHHQESNNHMDASDFELSAKIAVVQINRPWLNDLIFKMNGWSLSAQPKGKISNGTLKYDDGYEPFLPLIPTAFIVARDIAITADWSSEDKKHVEDSISIRASVGWGPFAVNGSYAHGSSSDYFNSTFEKGTLKIPGMQIIGWVNQIVPFSPPLSGL